MRRTGAGERVAVRAALRDPDIVHRRRWLTLLVLCISLIVITLDNTILNVTLPTLAKPVAQGGLSASIFLVNVPMVIGGLVLGFLLVPESRDPSKPKLDPFGALLSIAGLTAILWAIIEAPSHGWGSHDVLTAFAAGAVVLGCFFAWELHSDHPMLDMHFFEYPRFTAASGAITLTFFALFGTLFL